MKKKKGILGKIIIGVIVLSVVGAVFGDKGSDPAPETTRAIQRTQETPSVAAAPEKVQEPVVAVPKNTQESATAEPESEAAGSGAEPAQAVGSAPPVVQEESETEPEQAKSEDEISPELKAFLDSYEACMDEYCDFMANYDASDLSQLSKYTELISRYYDFAAKAEDWEGREMNKAETKYYLEVMGRVNDKLLKVSASL